MSNIDSDNLIPILILASLLILITQKHRIVAKFRTSKKSGPKNDENVFSEAATYAMELESRNHNNPVTIIAIFMVLIYYLLLKAVFPMMDNDIITLVISSLVAILFTNSKDASHSVTYDKKEWKEIYIQEKAIRIKYKDSFSAIDSADKGQSFDKSALSANLFYEYINELTGNENWLLDEVKYALIKNELLGKSEICLHSVWSVNVARELSKMLKEDVSYMDKWWQIIKDQKASQKVLNEE